jgi:hypothetical protein
MVTLLTGLILSDLLSEAMHLFVLTTLVIVKELATQLVNAGTATAGQSIVVDARDIEPVTVVEALVGHETVVEYEGWLAVEISILFTRIDVTEPEFGPFCIVTLHVDDVGVCRTAVKLPQTGGLSAMTTKPHGLLRLSLPVKNPW